MPLQSPRRRAITRASVQHSEATTASAAEGVGGATATAPFRAAGSNAGLLRRSNGPGAPARGRDRSAALGSSISMLVSPFWLSGGERSAPPFRTTLPWRKGGLRDEIGIFRGDEM